MQEMASLLSSVSPRTCVSCLREDDSNRDLNMTSDSHNVPLHHMLYTCTAIRPNCLSSYPRTLCVGCISKLTGAYEFYLQTYESHRILSEIFDNMATKSEDKENLEEKSGADSFVLESDDVKTAETVDSVKEDINLDDGDLGCLEEDHLSNRNVSSPDIKKKKNRIKNEKKTKENSSKRNQKTKHQYPPLYENPDEEQTCSICSESFSNVQSLIKHRAQHHGKNKFQCLTCGNGYTTTRGLRIHSRQHSGEKPEVCNICGKAFSDPRTLKSHERLHSGEQRFPCTRCDKKYSSRSALDNHMNSHNDERPYRCTLCHRSYRQAVSLKIHMRTHTGQRPHKCSVCSKAFTNTSSLRIHMLTHTGIKNYQCPVCGRCMSRSGELVIHMRSHSGERPYKCQHCDKGFTNKGALKAHIPMHTGEKNFSCYVCGKRMARSSELRVHLRSHSEEKHSHMCKHCGRKFSTRSNMLVHQRKHTGEKPHVCVECGRRFSDLHVLKNHRFTHSGESPYACPQPHCQKKFRQSSSLRAHLTTHSDATNANLENDKFLCNSESQNSEFKTRKRRIKQRAVVVTKKQNNLNSIVQQEPNTELTRCQDSATISQDSYSVLNNTLYHETQNVYLINNYMS